MNRSPRDVAVYVLVGAALVFGGIMAIRSFGGGVSDGDVQSMFEKMPTEELMHRRAVLAGMLAESPATEPKSEHRLKYEAGLAELDAILVERGVDPESAGVAAVSDR